MMKLYNLFILIVCFPLFSFSTTINKHEKTKTINKSFVVNKNATVFVNNKYGNIAITTWDENRVEITVKITVKGNNLEKVDDKLNAIKIRFEGSEDLVEARTEIENNSSAWSWWGNNNSKVNYKINYFIKMPKTNNADLYNKYGAIELNELDGKTNIRCDYGNVNADKLLNETNHIELNYCGSSEFDCINAANINADYSKIIINKCERIKSNLDYTSLKIGTVDQLSFNCDYGSVTVSEANQVSGNSDYASMKFGTIQKNLDVNTNYGGLYIKDLANNFESINIDSDYAGVKIGTSSDNNFNFNLNLSYAGFNYPEAKINFHKSIKKNTKKYYEGVFGTETNATMNIKSNYGGVTIKLND